MATTLAMKQDLQRSELIMRTDVQRVQQQPEAAIRRRQRCGRADPLMAPGTPPPDRFPPAVGDPNRPAAAGTPSGDRSDLRAQSRPRQGLTCHHPGQQFDSCAAPPYYMPDN